MSANDTQHGGKHYQSEYQHWDWAIDIGLGYLESAATKYLTRWRDKNGAEDVRKAVHYMEKAFEAYKENRYFNQALVRPLRTRAFLTANNIIGIEGDIITGIAEWNDELSAMHALGLMKIMQGFVDAGDDPRTITYWPGRRQASTVAPAGAGSGQRPSLKPPVRPQGSTNGVSDGDSKAWRDGMEHPFGYQED